MRQRRVADINVLRGGDWVTASLGSRRISPVPERLQHSLGPAALLDGVSRLVNLRPECEAEAPSAAGQQRGQRVHGGRMIGQQNADKHGHYQHRDGRTDENCLNTGPPRRTTVARRHDIDLHVHNTNTSCFVVEWQASNKS